MTRVTGFFGIFSLTVLLISGASAGAATSKTAPASENAATSKPLAITKPVGKQRSRSVARATKAKIASLKKSRSRSAEPKIQTQSPGVMESDISPIVANANARWNGNLRGEATVTAPLEAAAADQRAELDRSLEAPGADDAPRKITTQMVMNDQPQAAQPVIASPQPATPQPAVTTGQANASQADTAGDPWGRSSLIGKIFIAFGGMLTLASAARMLIA